MSSVASYLDHQDHTLYKRSSIHRRNNSGELDVFEAANYFSTSNTGGLDHHSVPSNKLNKDNLTTKSCKEDDQTWTPKSAWMSLDAFGRPSKLKIPELKQSGHKVHDDQAVKEKMSKNKQPSSPGGKLASFLNSLFNHSTSKKKKKPTQELKPRMRRSSISHVDSNSRSRYSSASTTATGFRTPPSVYTTFFDDSKSLQEHKRITPSMPPKQMVSETRTKSLTGLDHKPKISSVSLSAFQKIERNLTNGEDEKEKTEFEFTKVDKIFKELEFKNVDNNIEKHFEFKNHIKYDEEDGDDQSDTSSDLFELQNYDLGEFPSELPVYETTNVDQMIKNSAKPDTK